MVIKEVTSESDYAALAIALKELRRRKRIPNKSYVKRLTEKQSDNVYYVAYKDNEPIGAGAIFIGHFGEAWLNSVVILKAYRGMGLGTYLVKELMRIAGMSRTSKLWVGYDNKGAISVYMKCGLSEIHREPDGNGYEWIMMSEQQRRVCDE